MKYIITLFISFIIFFSSSAQKYDAPNNWGVEYKRLKVDSLFTNIGQFYTTSLVCTDTITDSTYLSIGLIIEHPRMVSGIDSFSVGIGMNNQAVAYNNTYIRIGDLFPQKGNWIFSINSSYPSYMGNGKYIFGGSGSDTTINSIVQVNGSIKSDSIITPILKSSNSYSQVLPSKSGTIALLSDVATKADTLTIPAGYITLGNGLNRKYNPNLWFDTSNNILYVDQQSSISNAQRSANFRKDVNSLSGLAIINGYNGTLSSGGLLLFGDSSQLNSNVYPGQVRKTSPNYTTSGGISANDLLIQAGSSGNIVIKPNNSTGYIRFIHANGSLSYVYIDTSGNLHADDSLKVNVLSASGNSYLATTTLNGAGAFTDGFIVNNAAIRAGAARFNTTLQNGWVNIGSTNTAPPLQISNNTTVRATFTYDGNFQLPTGSVTTAQPSVNGAGAIKFGKILTGSDSNKYWEVSVDGTNYYIRALTSLP